ncbi:hypothetical protein L7F22_065884 [Adiantum nelumboides]|nr:hypothetical protein [Adiantum nelumboides]
MRPPFEWLMLDPMGLLLLPAAVRHPQKSQTHDTSHHDTTIPPKLMRSMMLSGVWQRYERGQIPSLDAAATALAELPFVKRSLISTHDAGAPGQLARTIARCISHARSDLQELPAVATLVAQLQGQLNLKLVCMTNATPAEMSELQSRFSAVFARFQAIVISGEEGVVKASQHFMRAALQKLGICHAQQCLYLDASDMQSIVAARSVGMHAALIQPQQLIAYMNSTASYARGRISTTLEDLANLQAAFTSLVAQPLIMPLITNNFLQQRDWEAKENVDPHHITNHGQEAFTDLITRANMFPSLTSEGLWIWDNFAQFVMAEVLNDPRFLPMQSPPANGLICFVDKRNCSVDTFRTMGLFSQEKSKECLASSMPILQMDASTFKDIPNDLDTTSIGLSVLHKVGKVSMETINKVLDKMLTHVSKDDGVLQVYFDFERPRIDPVVVANAVYLFHLAGRGREVEASERFVKSVLLHRAYEPDGTIYYNLGEAFLLQVARLVHEFEEHFTKSGMRGLLTARLKEHRVSATWRRKREEDALALAMCMRAWQLCGVAADELEDEARQLKTMQREDRWWGCHAYYRYGGNLRSWIGSKALTTAYALAALSSSSCVPGVIN